MPLFLLLFAASYFLMAQADPANFSTHTLTRTDALYFTITIFATVGFGDISAWIHRTISEFDGVSSGQQAISGGMTLHLMGAGLKGRERAFDQRNRVISYVRFGGSRLSHQSVRATPRLDPR